jgi:Flp pilus assembly protein TadD
MNRWTARVCFAAGLLCAPLRAQELDANCNIVPGFSAEHPLGDQDKCYPEIPPRPAVTGIVSARALAHKPSRAAIKEFDRGVQAWRSGQSGPAVQHLAAAVQLDSNFVEALAELGVIYGKTGQPELALDCFTRAAVLEPNSSVFHSNKASALVILNRPKEAEPAARRAVQLDPRSIEAHFMLGMSMLMQEKITPEVAAHLAIAAPKYPKARTYLTVVQAALAEPEHPEPEHRLGLAK